MLLQDIMNRSAPESIGSSQAEEVNEISPAAVPLSVFAYARQMETAAEKGNDCRHEYSRSGRIAARKIDNREQNGKYSRKDQLSGVCGRRGTLK